MRETTKHDGLPDLLSIDNLANGAAYEMFNEALKRLAANVSDPNTDATQKRKITLTVTASPYKDRTGCELNVKVDTKLAGMKGADGMMYIASRNGEFLAFGRNTKQEQIEFGLTDTVDHSGQPLKAN